MQCNYLHGSCLLIFVAELYRTTDGIGRSLISFTSNKSKCLVN